MVGMNTTRLFDGKRWRLVVSKVCEGCGQEYFARVYKASTSKYCSIKCRGFKKRNRVTLSCESCGIVFERPVSQVHNGLQFCSLDCKNKEHRRGGKTSVSPNLRYCKECGHTVVEGKRTVCNECLSKRLVTDDMIISDVLYGDGRNRSRYVRVREHAVSKTSVLPQVCALTGYDRCAQTCHIVPISVFSLKTPLGVVNDSRNLVLLSPTPHWELDHGYLKPSDFGRELEFREWVNEVVDAGYLPDRYRSFMKEWVPHTSKHKGL